jgi:hypothetical protein
VVLHAPPSVAFSKVGNTLTNNRLAIFILVPIGAAGIPFVAQAHDMFFLDREMGFAVAKLGAGRFAFLDKLETIHQDFDLALFLQLRPFGFPRATDNGISAHANHMLFCVFSPGLLFRCFCDNAGLQNECRYSKIT